MRRLAAFVFLLATASSAYAIDPYPVPEGARTAALGCRSRWIELAKGNPEFYNIEAGMDVDKMELLDGFANVMIIGRDVVRFAESGKMDPYDFATRIGYGFPMMVEGVYVGSLVVRPRIAADPDTTGDYVFTEIIEPKGGLDRLVERIGGYSRANTFSVVSFYGESFGGWFIRLAADDGIRYVPTSASGPFFVMGTAVSMPAERAVPIIRAEILERARARDESGE